MYDCTENPDKSDEYDLPFGKASQTAKRYGETVTKKNLKERLVEDNEESEIILSQDLFASQDLNAINKYQENGFDTVTRSQIGMKCGKTVARNTKDEAKKCTTKNTKTFPVTFVSIQNSDLPHPKHLFKKKKIKRLKTPPEGHRGDLHDQIGSAVHGHIQQLRSKLAHRTTPKITLAKDNADLTSTETPILFEERKEQIVPDEEKIKYIPINHDTIKSPKQISESWDNAEISLYQRWMSNFSYTEEE